MEQVLVCRKCGKECGTRQSKTRCLKTRILVRSCEACHLEAKEHVRKIISERNRSLEMRSSTSQRMRRNNPMFDPDVVKKCSRTAKESYRTGQRKSSFSDSVTKAKAEKGCRTFWGSDKSYGLREKFRKRMARDNPMYDPIVAARVGVTRRSRIKDGRIVIPKGKEHWLWTGKRPFNLFVRTRLYKPWVLPIMERDRFTCTKCGRSKCVLHVHHLVTLDSIIATVLKEHGILDIEQEICSNRYSEVADVVVSRHQLSYGITVCKRCHAKIDKRYKGYGKESG